MWQTISSPSSKQKARTGYCSLPRELRQQILFAAYSPSSYHRDRKWGSFKDPAPTLQARLNGRKLTAHRADDIMRTIRHRYNRHKKLIDAATDMQYWLYDLDIIHYELIYDAEYVNEKLMKELDVWREEMERQVRLYDKISLPSTDWPDAIFRVFFWSLLLLGNFIICGIYLFGLFGVLCKCSSSIRGPFGIPCDFVWDTLTPARAS